MVFPRKFPQERIADGYTWRQFTDFYSQHVPKHHAFHRAFNRLCLAEAVQQGVQGFRNRTRAARRRMQEIQRMTTKERQERQTEKYRELIGMTQEVVESARGVLQQTRKPRGKNLAAELAIGELRKEIDRYCGLGDRVIDQARRRVLEREQFPTPRRSIPSLNPTRI